MTPHGVRLFGANGELADAVAPSSRSPSMRVPCCPRGRCGTPTSPPGGRSSPTCSAACFSPFSCPRTCCRSGSRWPSRALKLWVAAFGTFLLARALGMRAAVGAARGAWSSGSRFTWSLAGVAAVERLGAGCRGCCSRPTASSAARRARDRAARARRRAAVPRAGIPSRVPRRVAAVAVRRCCALARAGRPPPARGRGGARAGGGHGAGGDRAAPVPRAARAFVRPRPPSAREPGADTAALVSRARRCRTTGGARRSWMLEPFIVARAFYVGALPLMLAASRCCARRASGSRSPRPAQLAWRS